METELETQEKQKSRYLRKIVQDARHGRIRKDADSGSQEQTDEVDDVEPVAEVNLSHLTRVALASSTLDALVELLDKKP